MKVGQCMNFNEWLERGYDKKPMPKKPTRDEILLKEIYGLKKENNRLKKELEFYKHKEDDWR